MTATTTQMPDTVLFAGIGLAVEGFAGIGHAVGLLTATRTAEDTLGLAALPPLGAEVTAGTLTLFASAGLLLAAVLLARRSRTARWYAIAVQGLILVDVALRVTRGLPIVPALPLGIAAAVLVALLLAPPCRRWASIGLPPPAPRG